jgi:16S rRNA G966 N2-methylase RsmD
MYASILSPVRPNASSAAGVATSCPKANRGFFTTYWGKHKERWEKWGLHGKEGRKKNLRGGGGVIVGSTTSEFHPVLCEIVYWWYALKANSRILDPFAGGSTRGIVAAYYGHRYTGIELGRRQVSANIKQAKKLAKTLLKGSVLPEWIVDDSANLEQILKERHHNVSFNLVFTCPPYHDLERYSKSKHDLSAMPYDKFLTTLEKIYTQCANRLKPGGFFVVVVANFRDKKTGRLRNFVDRNIRMIRNLPGMQFHDEAVLLTPIWNRAKTASRPFTKSRKLTKTHENVLIFFKGSDVKAAVARLPKTKGDFRKYLPASDS